MNNFPANVKLTKTQLSKTVQSGGFFVGLLVPLLLLSVFIPLEIKTAVSATDAAIQMNLHILGTIPIIISIREIKDVMKIIKSFEEPDLLMKRAIGRIENEATEQKA